MMQRFEWWQKRRDERAGVASRQKQSTDDFSTNEGVEMTAALLRQICKESGQYELPALNERLYLHFKGFARIQNLHEYTQVKALWLEGNGLQRIEGLDHMILLKCLFLQQNCISKIENLDNCANLVTLDLSHNRLKTISGLKLLKNLSTIKLAHNAFQDLDDLSGLRECPTLSNVDLSYNYIDISPPKNSSTTTPTVFNTNSSSFSSSAPPFDQTSSSFFSSSKSSPAGTCTTFNAKLGEKGKLSFQCSSALPFACNGQRDKREIDIERRRSPVSNKPSAFFLVEHTEDKKTAEIKVDFLEDSKPHIEESKPHLRKKGGLEICPLVVQERDSLEDNTDKRIDIQSVVKTGVTPTLHTHEALSYKEEKMDAGEERKAYACEAGTKACERELHANACSKVLGEGSTENSLLLVRRINECSKAKKVRESECDQDLSTHWMEAFVALMNALPELRCLYFQGNPIVGKVSQYRKRVVAAIPKLRFLDERPVKEVERRRCEAWVVGGNEGELKAMAQMREEERAATLNSLESFRTLQRQHRDKVQAALRRIQEDERRLATSYARDAEEEISRVEATRRRWLQDTYNLRNHLQRNEGESQAEAQELTQEMRRLVDAAVTEVQNRFEVDVPSHSVLIDPSDSTRENSLNQETKTTINSAISSDGEIDGKKPATLIIKSPALTA